MENKEKLPGGEQEKNKVQEKALEWLNSYFQGTNKEDGVQAFQINGEIYIVRIEKFIPAHEQLKQWVDSVGLKLED